jgi:methyltransferase (TIGR00027 family)
MMIEKEPSWFARLIALSRGMHLLLDDDPKIYEDTLGRMLANIPDDDKVLGIDKPYWHRLDRGIVLRAHAVCRSRFVEDCLNGDNAISQFVILGAGLDSFAYRQPENAAHLTIFEVDHPASQNWKKRRLSELGVPIPHNVHYVPVDFEHQQLSDALTATSAFNRNAPTLFSFLGVIYYLPKPVGLNTFKQIRSSVDGYCQLAMDVALSLEALTRDSDRNELQTWIDSVQTRSEPALGLYTPDEIAQMLQSAGFAIDRDLNPLDIHERYLAGRSDELSNSGIFHLISAISAH